MCDTPKPTTEDDTYDELDRLDIFDEDEIDNENKIFGVPV